MIQPDDIVERLCQCSSVATLDSPDGCAPIGVFQSFRPDGLPDNFSAGLSARSRAFTDRLATVYDAVRSSQRWDNMKDAYFVVREPPRISASKAEQLTRDFLNRLSQLAVDLELKAIQRVLDESPRVRVLEGKAPRHPKSRDEKCGFLLGIEEDLPSRIGQLFSSGSAGERLSEALYFIACDKLLRDYLRWPLLDNAQSGRVQANDCFEPYFELWKHGIKLRIFDNLQVDAYIPR